MNYSSLLMIDKDDCQDVSERKKRQGWMNNMRHLIIMVMFLPGALAAQCDIDTSLLLREVDTLNLTIDIEGALNNDLSDPDQGLCKVRVNFAHEFLGDLQVYIVSPGGQEVQLIGPTGNFGLTQFSEWNVCFVPGATMANPDPGFADRWSNNQLWGSFAGVYTGSYYSFFGDLSDINTGPVNGTWTLRFVDRTIFYTSEVLGYELMFCDGTGIMCQPCQPGSFNFSIPVDTVCQGDSSLTFSVETNYSQVPDTTLYDETFFTIDSNDVIRAEGRNIDLSSSEPGTYFICGLSYYQPHQGLLPQVGDMWQDFLDSTRHGDIPICYGSTRCHEIEILPNADTMLLDTTICSGDSIILENVILKDSGEYFVSTVSALGCDSIIRVRLHSIDLQPSIIGDTLDCATPEILLDASASRVPTGGRLFWQTDTGRISDTLSLGIISVTDPGEYILTLEFGGCTVQESYIVIEDDDVPSIMLSRDTITCNDQTANFSVQTNANMPTFEWQVDGNVESVSDNYVATGSGEVVLTVTDMNGCTNSAVFEIVVDTIGPKVTARTDSITCLVDQAAIQLDIDEAGYTVDWTGPGGFIDVGDSITVDRDGWFVYHAIGSNGCSTLDSIEVRYDTLKPNVNLLIDTLNCLRDTVEISFDARNQTNISRWYDSQGLISEDSLVFINEAGDYTLEVEGTNGCLFDTSFSILNERDILNIRIDADSLKCDVENPKIWFATSSLYQSHSWTLPGGQRRTEDTLMLTRPGRYILLVETTSGCLYADTLQVEDYSNEYDISLTADTLTCTTMEAELFASSENPGLSYEWRNESGPVSTDSSFFVSVPGWYFLRVTDAQDCEFIDSIRVLTDTVPISFEIAGHTNITCKSDSAILRIMSTETIDSVRWVDPNSEVSILRTFSTQEQGVHHVTVYGRNGCASLDSIQVGVDTMKPSAIILSDTINCFNPSIDLQVQNPSDEFEYIWVRNRMDSVLARRIQVNSKGPHSLIVTDTTNGCQQILFDTITVDTTKAQLDIQDKVLPCSGDSIQIAISTTDSLVLAQWVRPDGTTRAGTSLTLADTGQYVVIAQTSNGCLAYDTFFVRSGTVPSAELFPDTITCDKQMVQLSAMWPSPVDSFFWFGVNGFNSSERDPFVDLPGQYNLVLQNGQDCRDTFSLRVEVDTLLPRVRATADGGIGCDNDTVRLQITDGDSSLWKYEWGILENGVLNDLSETAAIDVNVAGVYVLTATNPRNGCQFLDTVMIEDLRNNIFFENILSTPPSCSGGDDGVISIDSLSGGYAPFEVSFDDGDFHDERYFGGLTSGNYNIRVRDSLGCLADTSLRLPNGPVLMMELGPDQTINLGDTVLLIPIQISDTSSWISYQWDPDERLSSPLNYSTLAYPSTTTLYTLTIETAGGCLLHDDIRVIVDDGVNVFFPNSFSPNGDGINDFWSIFPGNGVRAIEEIVVFDRWGEKVYSSGIEDLTGQVRLWDGFFRGELVDQGVYVFMARIEDQKGDVRVISGDLTIIH